MTAPQSSQEVLVFKRLASDPNWPVPSYGTSGASGLDLAVNISEPITLAPGAIRLLPTGWSVAIKPGFEGQVRPRSGWALKHGITLVNSPGTIDSDYRGEISLAIINLGPKAVTINRGDRLAQLVIAKVYHPQVVVSDLDETPRGSGGFGSTGLNGA
ncbi:MAG: dUTP diphosphatase [Deltaproteobacteria bacterium]|jgi:dUTP pyrophosphatase|nr:dUTP diphosphatase [Deltaproteobacteria bacterium]